MLVRRGIAFDSVGKWIFHQPAPNPTEDTRENLHALLLLCQQVLEGLATQDLLRPQRIQISSWQKQLVNGRIDERDGVAWTLPPLHITPNDWPCQPSALVATVETAVDNLFQRYSASFHMPSDILIEGPSTLLDAQGAPHLVADALWVEAYTPIISINTRSDVWLPYSLLAKPQQELAARNAPRLKAALEAVETRVGAKGTSDYNDYAVIDGYTLRNVTSDISDEGEVIDVPYKIERLLNEPNPPAWLFEHEV